jgi:outer membrane receptor protein involved in Fe transport
MLSIRQAVGTELRKRVPERSLLRRHLLLGTTYAAAMPLFATCGSALAQPGAAANAGADAQAPQTIEEVTVTGSRIRRKTDFDSPNPTTVVDDSYLKNLGLVNVGDAVQQLPVNVSNDTPATTGNANFFAGSTIINLRGLNPFRPFSSSASTRSRAVLPPLTAPGRSPVCRTSS